MQKTEKSPFRRIVVKIGTHSLCGVDGTPEKKKMKELCSQIASLMKRGIETILVSSGAVGVGASLLLKGKKPKTLKQKQACAAVGQPILMSLYRKLFEKEGFETAQILLTGDVINHRERFLNAKNTFLTLLKHQVIPVVNENDSTSLEELRFGDNDNLAVNVAAVIEADACFLLSDIEGLYKNFNEQGQELISEVKEITEEIENLAVDSKKESHSTGGMGSKIACAKKASQLGIPLVILPAYKENILNKYFEKGEKPGTTFLASSGALKSKKKWLYLNFEDNGEIYLDLGAKHAIDKGKSLLSAGIEKIEGDFKRGDLIKVFYENLLLGKGIVNYSAQELEMIKKRKSEEIEDILGYCNEKEVVHRDNFVLISDS